MKKYILSDLYRFGGKVSILLFLKFFITKKEFRFILFFRLAKFLDSLPFLSILGKFMYALQKLLRVTDINYRSDIGPGFSIFHVFGTTWGPGVKAGKNFTVVHNVTIGAVNGKYPTFGDNVYISAGAVVIGDIKIGDNVVIGANAVVNKDIPDNVTVGGVPAKVVSNNNSSSILKNPIK